MSGSGWPDTALGVSLGERRAYHRVITRRFQRLSPMSRAYPDIADLTPTPREEWLTADNQKTRIVGYLTVYQQTEEGLAVIFRDLEHGEDQLTAASRKAAVKGWIKQLQAYYDKL
jgi:hypothetical protein